MFVIVGLGNPGTKYELNRHNIGFLVIDEITKSLTNSQIINKSNFKATTLKHQEDIFVKPQTFMNNSGESVFAIKEYFKIQINHIIVIHDDIDLPFGSVKFKIGGGHGGHNGLRSIDAHVGAEYIRVRIGIGKPIHKSDVAKYVLSDFSMFQKEHLPRLLEHVQQSIKSLLTHDLKEVALQYSLKQTLEEEGKE